MPRLSFEDNRYYLKTTFEERRLAQKAGFIFRGKGIWYSDDVRAAFRVREYADESAQERLKRLTIERFSWPGSPPFPEGLKPYPFQLEAARFALERSKSYLALDPGLGKSIVAALIMNALFSNLKPSRAIVITPPFLALNLEYEFKKWSMWKPKLEIFHPSGGLADTDILIMPDSLISKGRADARIERYTKQSCILFIDEAHRFKTPDAQRTQAIEKFIPLFWKVVFLSGTPMPSRPIELFQPLSMGAPETIDFMDRTSFGKRYCAGYFDGYDWNFKGASNLKELQKRVVGPFMLRLKKKDVLKELPDKREEMVIIGKAPARIIGLEQKLLEKHSPEDLMVNQASSPHISVYRRELGEIKIVPALHYIHNELEKDEEPLVIFGYHRSVIYELGEGLKMYDPFVITGDTPKHMRDKKVKEFQKSKTRRVLIANYLAGGIGFTLTKASRAIFVEWSWVSGENDQALDRLHRIGQKKSVLGQYLIFENSIDRKQIETVFRKKKITAYI